MTRSIRVATYNLGDNRHATHADLGAIAAAGARAICLQETLDRVAQIDSWCRANGWKQGPKRGDTRFVWNPPPRPTRRRTALLVPGGYIGPGAGPEHGVARYAPRLRYGWPPSALNLYGVHAVPTVENKLRRKKWVEHMAALVRHIGRRRRVVVMGDFNATPAFAGFGILHGARFEQRQRFSTHGDRNIDHVWARGADVTDVSTLGLSSDHRAVLFTVTW